MVAPILAPALYPSEEQEQESDKPLVAGASHVRYRSLVVRRETLIKYTK